MAFCYYFIFLIDKGIGNNVLIVDTNTWECGTLARMVWIEWIVVLIKS